MTRCFADNIYWNYIAQVPAQGPTAQFHRASKPLGRRLCASQVRIRVRRHIRQAQDTVALLHVKRARNIVVHALVDYFFQLVIVHAQTDQATLRRQLLVARTRAKQMARLRYLRTHIVHRSIALSNTAVKAPTLKNRGPDSSNATTSNTRW